ncbi:1-acylglycerol-3-phosphate O [Gyrodon lividus]|nr:1-acylglycerol-3-phosphate O [Gyrodon lividus]
MSFLALIVKPLVYISLPVLLCRSIANTSPVGRYYWRLSVFLGSLALVSTWGVVLAVGMTLVGRRHDVNYVVARTFYAVASRALDLKVEVEGEEHLQTRPTVMVGNHQSMLDILYLARMFPQKASIMAKRELQWTPLGPWMFMSGAIFIDRGNSTKAHKSLEAAGEEMKKEGISLMMYPEGTRHNDVVPALLPFKKGAFHLAVEAGLPVTPVVCENYWRVYHKGVFGTGTIRVRVLPPIQTTGLTVADVSDLATRTRDQMLAALREISVKVAIEEEDKSADLSGSTPEPTSTEAVLGPSTTNEVLPEEVPEMPSEETPSEATSSEPSRSVRNLRQDGSISECGTETDDEGMVHVRRPLD